MIIEESIAILLSFIAAVGWGLSATLFKRTTRFSGPVHLGNLDSKKVWHLLKRPPFLSAVLLKAMCASMYLMALSVAQVSVVGPLLALVYPSQAISARLINREPISKMDALSIAGVFVGVGMIAAFGVGIL